MPQKPMPLEKADLTKLREACVRYVNGIASLEDDEHGTDHLRHEEEAIFEAALVAIYGDDIWPRVNDRVEGKTSWQ